MEFQKIDAEELINDKDKILKIPHKCFCCNDTGLVTSDLIHEYVNNYNRNKSKPFICHNCESGDKFSNAYFTDDNTRKLALTEMGKQYAEITPQKIYQAQFDIRLNVFVCNKMHREEFEKWRLEEYQKIDIRKNIDDLVNKKSLTTNKDF